METIAAMDYFAVPTVTLGVLYRFSVISHCRQRILHFNVPKHPTTSWIIRRVRETLPFESALRFLIFDGDAEYGMGVPVAVRSLKMGPLRTSFRSPWQDGVAQRWVESWGRDLLDHVIALNERRLKRLLSEYICYYHDDRTHLGLNKETPGGRVRSAVRSRAVSLAHLGGLHNRYDRAA